MKTRLLITIILTVILISCEKESNDSIPELQDYNPKVAKISVPGIDDYHDIIINYQGELISSIIRPGDSILFFYSNEQLDSAIRFSYCQSGNCIEEQSVSFIEEEGKILQANFKSKNFANDTVRFRFIYDSEVLVAIKLRFEIDTLIFNNGIIEKIMTYQIAGGDLIKEHYGELKRTLTIVSSIDRPNPYYLVSSRLGFPYFSCVIDNPLGEKDDYTKTCISNYQIEDEQLGFIMGEMNYEYDDKGRIKSMFNKEKPELKTIIEYQ